MKYVLCFALFVVAVSAGGLIAPVQHAAVLPVLPVHKVVGVPLVPHHNIQPVHGRVLRSAIQPVLGTHNTVVHPATLVQPAAIIPAIGAGVVHGIGAGVGHSAGLLHGTAAAHHG